MVQKPQSEHYNLNGKSNKPHQTWEKLISFEMIETEIDKSEGRNNKVLKTEKYTK